MLGYSPLNDFFRVREPLLRRSSLVGIAIYSSSEAHVDDVIACDQYPFEGLINDYAQPDAHPPHYIIGYDGEIAQLCHECGETQHRESLESEYETASCIIVELLPVRDGACAVPMAPGLKHTREQHQSVVELAWDVSVRWGLPAIECWPGDGFTAGPRFDFDWVRRQLEAIAPRSRQDHALTAAGAC